MKGERLATASISFGLGMFGATIGLLCGLSTASGVSTMLITTLFSFVSGVVLTYASFQRPTRARPALPPPEGTPVPPLDRQPNVTRIGVTLALMSLGIGAGTLFGMYIRYGDPFGFRPTVLTLPELPGLPAATAVAAPETVADLKGIVGLQSAQGTADLIDRVKRRLESGFYKDPSTVPAASGDLRELQAVGVGQQDLQRQVTKQCGCR